MKERVKIKISDIENKVKDAEVIIVCSDKGTYLNGSGMELLMIFSNIVKKLRDSGVPRMFLQAAFEIGLNDMEEIEKMAENLAEGEFEKKAKEADKSLGILLELLKGIK